MTYNQSAYITDAMDGFAMQQTNFPFVAVIVDDASTDGEQAVIKSYIEEHFDHTQKTGYREWETEDAFCTFARHMENKNCYFVVLLLKQNLFGNPKKGELIREWCDTKYIALCEGDDYWTDPLKLQKQVDFLEGHDEFVLCAHRSVIIFEGEDREEENDQFKDLIKPDQIGIELNENNYFVIGILPQVLTVVYRKDCLDRFKWYGKLNLRSQYDQTFVYAFVELGKIWVMNEKMGVYRRHNNGVATSLSPKQAAEKMYYTWHDVYEVHHNASTKSLYLGFLQQYMYCLAKREGLLWRKEKRRLMKEYNALHEPLKNKLRLQMRLVKGRLLYVICSLRRSSDEE